MSAKTEVTLEDAFQLGLKMMQSGNTVVAEQTFKDILEAAPEHFLSHYYLGLALYYNGKFKEARDSIQKAIDIDGTEAEMWSNLAVMYYKMGDNDKAISLWEKALELNPKYADAYGNMANSFWEMGKHEEAEKFARKAIKLHRDYPDAWLNLGNALVSQGKFEEAMEVWGEALKQRPNFPDAYNNMGNALREHGRLKEAEEACRKAIAINPDYPYALNNLGNAVRDQGRTKEAEDYYRKAIGLLPSYAQAHNNLCVCLCDQNRFEEAIVSARYAVSFKPDYGDAYLNMSLALRMIGQTQMAEEAAQKAYMYNPDSAEAHIELADVRFMQDRYSDAEKLLKQALELKPDNVRLNLKIAQVMERALRVEEALELINQAAEENPEMPDVHAFKAQICSISNQTDEALASIIKAIELQPKNAAYHITQAEIWLSKGDTKKAEEFTRKAQQLNENLPAVYNTLSKIKKFSKDDADFKKLKKIEKMGISRGLYHATALHYALFEAYEDVGEYKKAFENLMSANEYKRKTVPYDRELQNEMYVQIKKKYTKAYLDSAKGKGFDSDVPVFIVGMPRSGTTLTEQIISSHPDAYGAGELTLLSQLDNHIKEVTPENSKEAGKFYVEQLKALDKTGKSKKITDKMPGNYLRIGEIISILPNARIIHCRRDPIDTCLSCFKQNFARGQYWSYNLEDLAHQYSLYEDLMAYWRDLVPDRFLDFDYEETVNNFEPQARKLVDFAGLSWNDACLEPHKNKRSVLTASKAQVIKPVYTSSVRSWKRYAKQLEPLMEALQYDKKLQKRVITK